jgi:hypothetical protein
MYICTENDLASQIWLHEARLFSTALRKSLGKPEAGELPSSLKAVQIFATRKKI